MAFVVVLTHQFIDSSWIGSCVGETQDASQRVSHIIDGFCPLEVTKDAGEHEEAIRNLICHTRREVTRKPVTRYKKNS